jgi:type IV secretion system protein VirD4
MKATRWIMLLLLAAMFSLLTWYFWPAFAPVFQHTTNHSLVQAFLLDSPHEPGRDPSGPFMYVMLAVMGLIVLDVSIDLKLAKSNTHGSARRATRRDTRNYRQPLLTRLATVLTPRPNSLAVYQGHSQGDEQRLLLGRYQSSDISLSQVAQLANVLLTAQIGAGKTTRIIERNLLRETGKRSLFISDVKAELVRECAGYLAQYYEVKVFAPTRPNESDGYNPLAYVHNQDDAMELADCWIENTGRSKNDDFWMKQARRLMIATILHLRTHEPAAPFYRIADILCSSTYEEIKKLLTASRHPYAHSEARIAFDAMDKNERLQGSVMADLGTRFQLLLSDSIRATTSRNDIDLAAMGERSMAVFLSIPPRAADRCHPIMALFMMHAFSSWEARAERAPGGVLPVKIQCYLDEFANLGSIYNLSGHLTTMRGAGIGLLIVLQSFAQLDERYGLPLRKTLLTNCGTHLLLPGAGLEECDYYSARVGDTTVKTYSTTSQGSGFLAAHTYNQGETRRRLFTPDELRTMKPDEMLVLGSSTQAIMAITIPAYRDRKISSLLGLPFAHTVIYQAQAAPPTPTNPPAPQLPGTPPASGPTGPVVDADLEDEGDDFMPRYQP